MAEQNQSDLGTTHPNAGSTSEPHNLEAETFLLGALLRDDTLLDEVDWLKEECWYHPGHKVIFTLLRRLHSRGAGYNFVTVKQLLQNDTTIQQSGGTFFLSEMLGTVAPYTSIAGLAQIIFDHYMRREMLLLCQKFAGRIKLESEEPTQSILEALETSLFRLAEHQQTGSGIMPLNEAIDKSMSIIENARLRSSLLTGLSTGFSDLDAALSGLHPSDLIILAGRPAMGKTAFATNLAINAAKPWFETQNDQGETVTEGAYVLFFSLEMSAEQLAMRIISQEANIDVSKLRDAKQLTEDDISTLLERVNSISDMPLFIDDSANLSVMQILQRARRFKRKNKGRLGLIVIDYLQLIQPDPNKRYGQKVQEITDISRDLKLLARELSTPVVALSQLSREVEKRTNKRPQLSDLRESGAIEQDADVVMFLYREEYYIQQAGLQRLIDESDDDFSKREDRYVQRLSEVTGKADLIIAKYRHGPTADIAMNFDPLHTRFFTRLKEMEPLA